MVAAIKVCNSRKILPSHLIRSLNSNMVLIEKIINSYYKVFKTSLDQLLQAKDSAQGLDQIRYQLLSEVFLIAGCYQLAIDSVTCTHRRILLTA